MGRHKKIAFLTRRQDLSKAQFTRHWGDIHGPTVAGAPGYAAWRDRYVQDHIIGPAFGEPFTYDGMAEFWLPSANEDQYASSDTYQAHVRPDELNFINFDHTISMTATETVLLPEMGGAKLVILAQRQRQLSPEAYAQALAERCRAARSSLGVARVSGSLDLVQDGSARLPGARPAYEAPVNSVWTLRFTEQTDPANPSIHEWLSELLGLADESLHEPRGTVAFWVQEIVFFENGRPA